jgi:hypothetical protein
MQDKVPAMTRVAESLNTQRKLGENLRFRSKDEILLFFSY